MLSYWQNSTAGESTVRGAVRVRHGLQTLDQRSRCAYERPFGLRLKKKLPIARSQPLSAEKFICGEFTLADICAGFRATSFCHL